MMRRNIKVKNNRPVLIWSEQQDWDFTKNQSHCVQQERRADKMVIILDVWTSGDDGAEQCVEGRLF